MEKIEQAKKIVLEMNSTERETLLKWLGQNINASTHEEGEPTFEAAAERTFQKYGPALKKLADYDRE